MNNVANKIAIVTGASHERSIATAVCRKLASRHITIFFTYWKADTDWTEAFQQEIIGMGVQCGKMEIDLSASDAASVICDTVVNQLGAPSILVNSAAHSENSSYLTLDAKTLDDHYMVNVRSTFLLCVEFARRFEQTGLNKGRIINMTSGQDLGPMPNELAYAATKGAISAFTRSLAQELAPLDITVNAVNPGPTDSTWMTDEIRKHLLPKFPMKRIGTPEDAAQLIDFLASEEAQWITGQVIHSEGGFMRG